MNTVNISGYLFVNLTDLPSLREKILAMLNPDVKGTILLSFEGININLAGSRQDLEDFKIKLAQNQLFEAIRFKESLSLTAPFNAMKVKLKKEIITMGCDDIQPQVAPAAGISATIFKQWLDEGRDMTVLDTRNTYEVKFGTFDRAVHLNLQTFSEFPNAAGHLSRDKPVVMFCTGGVRCEKAALQLQKHGLKEVYQLEGGILKYFEEVGGDHYRGACFVFDERIALTPSLTVAGLSQCIQCEGPKLEIDQPCMSCTLWPLSGSLHY
jgi:UPF0176 protein